MNQFKRIAQYVIPYWTLVALNFVFNLLSVIFSLFSFTMAIPFLNILFERQEVVSQSVPFDGKLESIQHNFNYLLSQTIVNHGKEQALLLVVGFVVVTVFFKTLFWYGARYVLVPVRNNVIRDIRNKLFNKILVLPLGYFTDERKGDLISRMTSDVKDVEESVVRSINTLLKEPTTILVYMVSLIFISWQLTVFVFVLLPVSGTIIGRIGKNLKKKSRKAQNMLGDLLSMIEETLTGMRIIKAFSAEGYSRKKFENYNQEYTDVVVRMSQRIDLASPLSEFLGTTVVTAVMWFGGRLVLGGSDTLGSGELITYLIIFSQVLNPAKALSGAYYTVIKGMASADRIDDVLNAQVRIQEKPDAKPIGGFEHAIEFRNVSFRYQEKWVLRNINLAIPKGQTIALVGQSGSGKSTLVDLIPRFYDVQEGEILIDGISVKDLKINDLRQLMGNVNQESILFNDTVRNNIAFGLQQANDAQIEAAARVANAHDFISEMPEAYESNIGDRGGKLSGGQRQRVSIARAVLKNPPIMILDEATSALDTESERAVQDALTKLMENRTSLVIAHRLSTIKHADSICVLHEGQIVEQGKHDELIAHDGIYKRLHDIQMFA